MKVEGLLADDGVAFGELVVEFGHFDFVGVHFFQKPLDNTLLILYSSLHDTEHIFCVTETFSVPEARSPSHSRLQTF